MTAREIDIHTLPSMLTALRLPSFHKLWAEIATPFYNKAGPTPKAGPPPGPPGLLRPSFDPPDRMIACRDRARSLAVLAEYELAERDMRRIRRLLTEAQLPAGKTLATFDFKALPSLPHARVEAFAAGDWLDGGGNLIAPVCQIAAIPAPARPTSCAPLAMLWSKPGTAPFTLEPAIWCKSSRPPAAISSSRPPWPNWIGLS